MQYVDVCFTDRACFPEQNGERLLTFELPLDMQQDRCGLTRVHNRLTVSGPLFRLYLRHFAYTANERGAPIDGQNYMDDITTPTHSLA
jgi:hypothetical protein